jgi:hypothetical protein
MHLYKVFYRPVISLFILCVEETGRDLTALTVIMHAFAAFMFAAAGFISAVAHDLVLFHYTLHVDLLSLRFFYILTLKARFDITGPGRIS